MALGVEEALPGHSPVVHVRRPQLGHVSHAIALERNEPGWPAIAALAAG